VDRLVAFLALAASDDSVLATGKDRSSLAAASSVSWVRLAEPHFKRAKADLRDLCEFGCGTNGTEVECQDAARDQDQIYRTGRG
jgi:hypothetical protein